MPKEEALHRRNGKNMKKNLTSQVIIKKSINFSYELDKNCKINNVLWFSKLAIHTKL